jgi:glycosyltransferase involved in cell wall biosynthesis
MAAPLKVGFVVPGVYVYFNPAVPWPPGGSERQAYLLGQALAERGDTDVHHAVADFGQPERELPSLHVQLWRSFRYGDPLPRGLRRLTAVLRAMDADVFVFRSASAGVAAGMWVASQVCRKPVVYMLAHDDESQNSRMATWLGWPGTLLMAAAYRLPHAICAQSEAQCRAFESRRGLSVAGVVPNACELLPASALTPASARRTVLWVGRAQEWKRGDAFIALAKRFPAVPFVMMCSTSTGACEARWRDEAAEAPNLRWYGPVPHADLAAHYAEACLFVNTSRAEGVPNSMLEAMAAGCPVLSAVVDPGGALAGQGAGRCLGTLDEVALADACRELLHDVAALEAMGRAARRFVETVHAPGVAAEALLKVLRQVCEAKGPSPCVA